MRIIAGIVLICCVLGGCATSAFMAHVEKRDPASPGLLRQHSDTIRIKIAQPLDQSYALFRMNYTMAGDRGGWSLSTMYHGPSWLLVRSIRFELDGEEYDFKSLPDAVREYGKLGAGEATEQNIFTVTDSFMTALGSATEASVWLWGENERVGRKLSARDLHNIAWYVRHVRANRDAPRPGQAEPYSR